VATTDTTTGTTTGTTSGTTTGTTLTPVQQKLQKNTNLAKKLEGRLGGADLMTAAEGFRNLGQFVAAVNVSNNLGLSFTELKTRMVDDGMSLGQAAKDLRSSSDTTTAVKTAEADADRLIATTEVATTKKNKKGGQ